MPGNVFLPAAVSGLSIDSVINVTALVTLDKTDLEDLSATRLHPSWTTSPGDFAAYSDSDRGAFAAANEGIHAERGRCINTVWPPACLPGRGWNCQPESGKCGALITIAERPYLPRGCGRLASSAVIRCAGADRRSACPGRIHRPHRHRCSDLRRPSDTTTSSCRSWDSGPGSRDEAGEFNYGPAGARGLRSSSTRHPSLRLTHAMAPACTCPSWSPAAPASARPTTGGY